MERHKINPIEVSRETIERLRIYESFVLEWTKKINLIGKADAARFWQRHIMDCLQLIQLIPEHVKTGLDLGSGAGLPGLVLALSTDLHITLIEADVRKAAFLRAAVLKLEVPVRIISKRIEAIDVEPFPLITARALAPLHALLELAIPKLTEDGMCLFMKGENCETELTLAQKQWQMKVERFQSRTSSTATILRLSEIRRAPPGC